MSVTANGASPLALALPTLRQMQLRAIPLGERSKVPVQPGWPELASTEEAVHEGWVRQFPNGNAGAVLGLQPGGWTVFVIDLDLLDGGSNGGESLDEYRLARQFDPLPRTFTVRTGGGGIQLYFYASADLHVPNATGVLEGVDVRGDGGQCVFPPSVHPSGGVYEVVYPVPIAPAPPWLLGLVKAYPRGEARPATSNGRVDPAVDGPPIPEGERNGTLFRIGSSARARGMSRNAVLGLLHDVNQARCQPPIEDMTELETIADSASKYDPGSEQPNWPPKPGDTEVRATTGELTFRSISEMKERRRAVTWLVRGWWTDQDHGVVGGSEKALKTWFLVMMAIAVAAGRPFLNVPEYSVTQRRVLLITGEGGSDLLLDRIEHACKFYGIDVSDLEEWLYVADDIVRSSSPGFRDNLTTAIALRDPGAVIVDPAYVYLSVGDGEAGNVFKMGQLLSDLADLCRGRATVVAHHFRKAVGQEPELADLTQAGFREWAAAWALLWHRDAPDVAAGSFRLGVKWGGRRGYGERRGLDVDLGPLNLDTLTHHEADADGVRYPRWSLVDAKPAGGDGVSEEDMRRVLDAIADLDRMSRTASTRAVQAAARMKYERVKKVLETAAQQGQVVEEDGPRNSIIWSLTQLGVAHLEGTGLWAEAVAPDLGV